MLGLINFWTKLLLTSLSIFTPPRACCGSPHQKSSDRRPAAPAFMCTIAPLTLLLVPISAMRVLCLHGKGGSAASFLDDLQPLRSALPAIEFEAMDAPGGTRSWWTYPRGERSFSASSFSGDDESIAAVEAELVKGGYDGILGFSQGAMLAAVVAARSALGQGPPDSKLSLTVCCGAALPKPFEPLFAALRESGGAPAIRSLHCLSAVDTMNPPELGKALATSFGTSASLLWHDNGHTVPPSESLGELVAFFEAHPAPA